MHPILGYIGLEPGVLYSMSGSTGAGQEVETEELDGVGGIVLPENASPAGLRVYGKCEQETNSGLQLFDCDNVQYIDNLAYVLSSNTFSTGASNGRMYYIEISPSTSYTISKTMGTFLQVCTCPEIPADGGAVTNSKSASLQTTITTGAQDKYLAIYPLVVDEHDTIGYDAIEKDLMVNVGSTALPWEAYTGGVSLPDPDQPQEIRSVGARTRNLLDEEAARDYENWGEYPNDQGSVSTGYKSYRLELKPNTTYTISRRDDSGFGKSSYILVNKKGTTNNGEWIVHSTRAEYNRKTISVTTEDAGALFITANISSQDRLNTRWAILGYLQIEEGSTATEYEPYGYKVSVQTPQQRLNVYMREPLRGAPVSSNGNYTDQDGQQWVCDVLDLGARKILRRTRHLIFGAEKNWMPYKNGGNTTEKGFYVANVLPEVMWRRNGWCNLLPVRGASGGTKTVWIGANNTYVYALTDVYDDEAEDKGLADWLAHLEATPLELVTYLAETEEEDLLPGGTEIEIDGGGVIPGLSLEYKEGA